MAKIYYNRTLHPVGQGAFFTEHFRAENSEVPFFNIVYDCGSFTGANRKNLLLAPTILKNKINKTFPDMWHIDFLFISHFDGDHTNGLNELLHKNLLDNKSYVFIPFKYPYLIPIIMHDDYPELAYFIDYCIKLKVNLIGFDGDENKILVDTNIEAISIENLRDSISEKVLLKVNSSTDHHVIWFYMPFILPEANQYRTTFISEVEKIEKINLNDVNSVIEHKEELRQIYKNVGKKIGNNTRINSNSLLLLSFPAKGVLDDIYCWKWCPQKEVLYRCSDTNCILVISCLYTGDTNLTSVYSQIIQFATNVLKHYSVSDIIGTVQIPHHGSKECYPSQITTDHMVFSSFVNFSPNYNPPVFDMNILRQFAKERKQLYLIASNCFTRVEMCADLL